MVKSTNLQYLGLDAKMEKSKTTSFSQTFEVAENKEPLFFFIFDLQIFAFDQSLRLAEITCKKYNLFY